MGSIPIVSTTKAPGSGAAGGFLVAPEDRLHITCTCSNGSVRSSAWEHGEHVARLGSTAPVVGAPSTSIRSHANGCSQASRSQRRPTRFDGWWKPRSFSRVPDLGGCDACGYRSRFAAWTSCSLLVFGCRRRFGPAWQPHSTLWVIVRYPSRCPGSTTDPKRRRWTISWWRCSPSWMPLGTRWSLGILRRRRWRGWSPTGVPLRSPAS